MSAITLDDGSFIYRTPYNAALVADLKAQIPATDRQWDGATKAWRVTMQHGPLLVQLAKQYFGEHISIPAIPGELSKTRVCAIECRYIGMTKERGGDEQSAFGYVDGQWAVIFPESVLRKWFDMPKRPDEETTLYQVLMLKRDASGADVKAAFRRLSRQWHPDVCQEPGAAQVFMRIKTAYDLLSNPAQRARYDAGLKLAGTLGRQEPADTPTGYGYRSPLRCGLLLCEGNTRLKRFVVSQILAWEDICDAQGRMLSVSWPVGSDKPVESWV